jgi:hypothetical protein
MSGVGAEMPCLHVTILKPWNNSEVTMEHGKGTPITSLLTQRRAVISHNKLRRIPLHSTTRSHADIDSPHPQHIPVVLFGCLITSQPSGAK